MISWMGIHTDFRSQWLNWQNHVQIHTIGSRGICQLYVCSGAVPMSLMNRNPMESVNVCECLCHPFNENNQLTQSHTLRTVKWWRMEVSFFGVSFRQYWMGFFSTCFPPSVQYPIERWRHHNVNFKSTAKSAVLFVCSTIRLLNDKHSVMVSWLLMQIPVQFERSTRWGIQLMVSVMQTCKMKKKDENNRNNCVHFH